MPTCLPDPDSAVLTAARRAIGGPTVVLAVARDAHDMLRSRGLGPRRVCTRLRPYPLLRGGPPPPRPPPPRRCRRRIQSRRPRKAALQRAVAGEHMAAQSEARVCNLIFPAGIYSASFI